jgi:hypothetical protein
VSGCIMSTIKSLLSLSGLLILGAAAGCAQPGVIEEHRADAGKPKKDAGNGQSMSPSNAGDDDDDVQPAGDDDDDVMPAGDDDDDVTTPVKDAGVSKDSGPNTTKDTGTKPDTSKDAGPTTGGPDKLGPCPDPYMCQDPAKAITDLGFEGTVTDADGKPIKLACGKGDQEDCDPKDPKKSCPNLPNPFCAHVVIMGLVSADLYNCAQLCSP